MNYTLHQLQIFLKVCETGSITKSSEELFLTQPAVSIQLKKFQEQFELPLTELIGRRIYITEFGKELEKVAKRILAEAENINQTANAFKGLLVGSLSLSIVSTAKYIMPYFLNDFVKKYPAIKISIDVTNKSKVVDTIEKNEADFALVSILPDGLDIEFEELMQNKLYLVGEGGDNEVSKVLLPKDLVDFPMIFREKGSATRKAMEQFLVSNQIVVKNLLELVSNEAVKQSICAGLGYSIMPLIGMKDELKLNKIKIIDVKGLPLVSSWNLIYNRNKSLSPAAKAFLGHIKTNKNEIINKYFSAIQELEK